MHQNEKAKHEKLFVSRYQWASNSKLAFARLRLSPLEVRYPDRWAK